VALEGPRDVLDQKSPSHLNDRRAYPPPCHPPRPIVVHARRSQPATREHQREPRADARTHHAAAEGGMGTAATSRATS
jgi:hypothetical protein